MEDVAETEELRRRGRQHVINAWAPDKATQRLEQRLTAVIQQSTGGWHVKGQQRHRKLSHFTSHSFTLSQKTTCGGEKDLPTGVTSSKQSHCSASITSRICPPNLDFTTFAL